MVSLPRRRFLKLASVAALSLVTKRASAQTYPSRSVRLISPFPAGGPSDLVARLIGQWLSERFAQPIVVENRPGGGGNIATEAVAKTPPDGYTLLLVSGAHAVNVTLHNQLSFDFIRDIAPVAGIVQVPNVIVVHPSIPAKSLPEFIAYTKANPGKINFASGGIGTTSHVMGELFKMMAGIDMVHVPYRGAAPVLNDLLGGQVQVAFSPTAPAIELIRTGKLRALAVTGSTRSEALPAVPTVNDFVPGYEANNWFGIGAPMNTPPEIVDRLNKEINAALGDPKIKARFADLDCTVLPGSPAEFGKLIAGDVEKWSKVIKFAGIRTE
jgi:tripartite-type tricarboxylate transporter receptor subunit TctC